MPSLSAILGRYASFFEAAVVNQKEFRAFFKKIGLLHELKDYSEQLKRLLLPISEKYTPPQNSNPFSKNLGLSFSALEGWLICYGGHTLDPKWKRGYVHFLTHHLGERNWLTENFDHPCLAAWALRQGGVELKGHSFLENLRQEEVRPAVVGLYLAGYSVKEAIYQELVEDRELRLAVVILFRHKALKLELVEKLFSEDKSFCQAVIFLARAKWLNWQRVTLLRDNFFLREALARVGAFEALDNPLEECCRLFKNKPLRFVIHVLARHGGFSVADYQLLIRDPSLCSTAYLAAQYGALTVKTRSTLFRGKAKEEQLHAVCKLNIASKEVWEIILDEVSPESKALQLIGLALREVTSSLEVGQSKRKLANQWRGKLDKLLKAEPVSQEQATEIIGQIKEGLSRHRNPLSRFLEGKSPTHSLQLVQPYLVLIEQYVLCENASVAPKMAGLSWNPAFVGVGDPDASSQGEMKEFKSEDKASRAGRVSPSTLTGDQYPPQSPAPLEVETVAPGGSV